MTGTNGSNGHPAPAQANMLIVAEETTLTAARIGLAALGTVETGKLDGPLPADLPGPWWAGVGNRSVGAGHTSEAAAMLALWSLAAPDLAERTDRLRRESEARRERERLAARKAPGGPATASPTLDGPSDAPAPAIAPPGILDAWRRGSGGRADSSERTGS